MGDLDRTEDAVAQTFLLAWRDLPKLRKGGSFQSWLFRIAHNCAMSELRRRPNVSLEEAAEPRDESRFSSPLAAAEARADAAAVQRALLKLPHDQRAVLVLRCLRDLTHAEVAEEVGKSEEATRALQYRALRRMKDVIEHEH